MRCGSIAAAYTTPRRGAKRLGLQRGSGGRDGQRRRRDSSRQRRGDRRTARAAAGCSAHGRSGARRTGRAAARRPAPGRPPRPAAYGGRTRPACAVRPGSARGPDRPRPRCPGCRPARGRRRAAASISSARVKVRARASSRRKLSRRQVQRQRLPADRGGGEIDRQRHVEARAAGRRRAQFGERVAVADPDRAADLDRGPRRRPVRRCRRNPAGTRMARRNRPGSAVPARRPRSARCRCQQPASAAIRCSTVPIRAGAHPAASTVAEPGVDDVVEPRRDIEAEIGAAEHDAMIGRRRAAASG